MAENKDAGPAAASVRPRLGLSLCGGFVTATALETGIAEVLCETGVISDLRYISATSAGSFVGVALATNRPERVREMSEFVRALTPKKVFRRRFIFQLGFSHLLVILAAKSEEWERTHTILGKLPARLFRRFLRDPNLHIDAFNDFQIYEEITKAFDYHEINRELAVSPIELEVVYTNMRTGETETCSSKILREALSTGDDDVFLEASKRFRNAVFASASANVFFSPWRYDGKICSDGALIRPDPLGFVYNAPVDKILHVNPNISLRPEMEIVTIGDAIRHSFDIMQRYLAVIESRSADEKTSDVKELRALRRDLRRIIEHLTEDPEAAQRLKNMIDERFSRAGFSFREDRPIDRVEITPSWEPPVEVSLYGGYADFSKTIPAAIERGRRETLRVLSREKLIPSENEENS